MAAAAPLSTPVRQPFGSVSNARLRNLGNTKNKQNALCTTTATTSSTSKSAPPQTFNDIDSENIDPSIFASSKSSKNHQSFSDFKTSSSSAATMQHFRAATSLFSKARLAPNFQLATAGGQKRKASVLEDFGAAHTDRLVKTVRTRPLEQGSNLSRDAAAVAAATAVAPRVHAGRSPKSKRTGILSRRRVSARVDPPSFNHGLPSIDAALSGTLRSCKPKPTSILDQVPKGWRFKIHEDTEDEHDSIIMQHSTCTLDLSSDDEDRVKARDDRGKENIPPSEGLNAPATTTATVARSDIMTDGAGDARPALTALNAADYYAPGVGAGDHFLVPAEGSSDDSKSNIDSLTAANVNGFLAAASEDAAAADTSVDIWESESAKAESEVAA